jgi:hypothetical protein
MAGRGSLSLTPVSSQPPQRSGAGGPDGQVIVERVVEKVSAGPANYPLLTKSNYNQSSLLMKIKLEARGLWGAIEPGDAKFQVD